MYDSITRNNYVYNSRYYANLYYMKGNLNIPTFPEELKKAAKKAAIDNGITLRVFVINAIRTALPGKKSA